MMDRMITGDSDLYHQTKGTVKDAIGKWMVREGVIPEGNLDGLDDQLWDLATDIMGIYEGAANHPDYRDAWRP